MAIEDAELDRAVLIRGLEAWMGDTQGHVSAQITQLLCIGMLLQGHQEQEEAANSLAIEVGAPRPRKAGDTAQGLSLEQLRYLALTPQQRTEGMAVPDDETATEGSELSTRMPLAHASINPAPPEESNDLGIDLAVVSRLWTQIENRRSARSALALLNEGMDSPHEQVRAMSAAVLLLVHNVDNNRVHAVLTDSAQRVGYSYEFAALALELPAEPETAIEASPIEGPQLDGQNLSIIVHGTFARLGKAVKKWYRPQAELPVRIRDNCTPDLYDGELYFRWTARYSEAERQEATNDLLQWCADHGIDELDTVFAHSHGGNVVLGAVERGLHIKLLVLLHTPVLPRPEQSWLLIQSNIGRIVDMRTPFDWVVHLDGLKTHSKNSLPSELTRVRTLASSVPSSFRASHTHYIKDSVWESLDLTNEIKFERSMTD